MMGTQTRRSDAEMLADIDADVDAPIGPPIDATPIHAISAAVAQRRRAEDAIVDNVTRARALGLSWTLIAEALGVSRQAARQRYGQH